LIPSHSWSQNGVCFKSTILPCSKTLSIHLIQVFLAINFLLITAFNASHSFWYVVFTFSFGSLLTYVSTHWSFQEHFFLISMYLYNFQNSSCWLLILFHYGERRCLVWFLLAILAPIDFGSYCTLKLLFSRITVLPQV
jgi:hypothetical protein